MPSRPVYMLIFNDLLRKHNDSQPKFAPAPTAPPLVAAKINVAPVSISFSDTSSAPSVTAGIAPAASGSASLSKAPPTGSASIKTSSAARDVVSRTNSESTPLVASHEEGGAPAARASVSSDKHTPPAPTSPAVVTIHQQQRPQSFHVDHLTSQVYNKRSNQSVPHPAGPPIVRREPAALATLAPTTTTTSATGKQSPARKVAGKVAVVLKDSAPGISQTPAGVLGNSNSLPAERRRPLIKTTYKSLAKTIAEQTPNAFKTLGPGFNRRAAEGSGGGSHSQSQNSSSNNTLASGSMPSDYEHIFHAPSQISDLPSYNQSNTSKGARKHKKQHHGPTAKKSS